MDLFDEMLNCFSAASKEELSAAIGCLREPSKYMLDCAATAFFADMPHVVGMQRARRIFSTMAESLLRESEERV